MLRRGRLLGAGAGGSGPAGLFRRGGGTCLGMYAVSITSSAHTPDYKRWSWRRNRGCS